MFTLILLLSALPNALSAHLIYTETSVNLKADAVLFVLGVDEHISLRQPVLLYPNRRYAITFKFNTLGKIRTYRGASGPALDQCSLLLDRINSSWVFPFSTSLPRFNFNFNPNVGLSTGDPSSFDIAQINTATTTAAGFGQTWNSGQGGNFTSFYLQVPGLQTNEDVATTLNIYDLSEIATDPYPRFPYWQETSSPTTRSPTTAPSKQPTTAPSKQPTPAPTPAFFNPPGCNSTLIPTEFQNSTVSCNQTNNQTIPPVKDTTVIGGVITITIVDKNGTKIVVKDLPKDRRIYFFIDLTPAGKALLARNDPCEPAPELSCAWLSGNDWLVSGCELAPELGNMNADGTEGRFCVCNHLTSFSLILRPKSNIELCATSNTRYVMAAISGAIALVALIQSLRAFYCLRAWVMLVNIHLAVASGALLQMGISLLAPTLNTEPAILVFLSSIVTFIELCCYIYLVYVWIGFTGNINNFIDKLKWPFRVFLLLTLLIAVGIPIAMISSEPAAQLSLARIGSYLMCALTAILCCGLMFSGLKVRKQLLAVRSNLTGKRCSLPTRMLMGSIGLGGSVLAQAVFWALSVDDTVLDNNKIADGIDLGFNLSAFVTFITLLFMFFFGVRDVTRKSRRTNTHGSRMSRGSRSEQGSRAESMISSQGPQKIGGAIALAGVVPALPNKMPDIASLPKRRFSYVNTDDDLPDLPSSPAPEAPPPDYEAPTEYSWEPVDKM